MRTMAWNDADSTMYTIVGVGSSLATLLRTTGTRFTIVGSITGDAFSLYGLAWSGSVMYATGAALRGSLGDRFATLDLATRVRRRVGTVSFFGVNEFQMIDITWDHTTNTLYGIGQSTDALYTINTITGVATRVGSANQFGVSENLPLNIAADSAGNLLMVGTTGGCLLYTSPSPRDS